MKKIYILSLLIVLLPFKVLSLIQVDITRGNFKSLPIAVSPLSIDDNSKKILKVFWIKKILVQKFQ